MLRNRDAVAVGVFSLITLLVAAAAGVHGPACAATDYFIPLRGAIPVFERDTESHIVAVSGDSAQSSTGPRPSDHSGSISEYDEIMLATGAGGASMEGKALAHYSMGVIYEEEGALDRAIEEYREVIRLDPDAMAGYIRLGAVLLISDRTDESIEVLQKAETLDTSGIEAPFLLALAYTREKNFGDAAREYGLILERNPRNLRALSSLADIYVLQERLEDAAGVYERLLETEDGAEEPLIYFNLGIMYSKLDRTEEAIKNFEKAVSIDKNYIQAYVALAVLYESQKDYEKAVSGLEDALKIEPLNRRIAMQLADLYYEAGRKEDAVHQYRLLIELDPNTPEPYIGMASLYMRDEAYDKAGEVLDEGIKAPARDAVRLERFLGFMYSAREMYGEAINVYADVIERFPDDQQAIFYLGASYERSGQREKAMGQFRRCLELDPDNAEANNYLGYMYAEDGENLDEALAMVKKALEQDPDNGAYIDSLGWVYYRKGMLHDALRELERAASLIGNDATILDHLGDIHHKMGNDEKALEEWKKSLELDHPSKDKVREKIDTVEKKQQG